MRLSLLSLLSAVAHAVSSQEIIHTKQNMNCTTEGVLYLITCTKSNCKKQYIGETGQAVYERYGEHETSARDPNTTKVVGKHFQLPGHTTDDMEMIPIEKVRGDRAVRKGRERAMIWRDEMV